jgi:TonB family protein
MGTQKSMAFGLSALLHLGLVCLLSLVLIKPVVSNRIMEIDLTTWSTSVTSFKGKHGPKKATKKQQDAPKKTQDVLKKKQGVPKKVSANTVKHKPPVIHKTRPAKRVLPEPVQRAVKTLSHDHGTKISPLAHDSAQKTAPSHAEKTATSTTAETGTGHLPSRSYFAAVLARIKAAKKYPPSAVRRRIQGNTVVTFRLAPDGRLLFNHLQKSSGYDMLDQAALAAVRDAAPFPSFSDMNDIQPRSMSITISFVLKN